MTDWITGNRIQTSAFKSPYIPSGTEFWAQHLSGTPYAGLAVSVLRRGRLDPSPDSYDDGEDYGEAVASLSAASEAVVESKGDVKAGVKPEVKAKPKAEAKRKEAKTEPEEEYSTGYVVEEDYLFNPLVPLPTELQINPDLAIQDFIQDDDRALPPHASPVPRTPEQDYMILRVHKRDGTVERRRVPWERGADGRLSSQ